MRCTTLLTVGHLATLAWTGSIPTNNHTNTNTTSSGLGKEALSEFSNYLNDGLAAHLPPATAAYTKWKPGSLPAVCRTQIDAENQKLSAINADIQKLSANDVEVYNVLYDDCSVPWVICRHKHSPDAIPILISTFGRVPVRARQFVRHVMVMPRHMNLTSSGYYAKGTIVLYSRYDSHLISVLHETAHCLDFLGAYKDYPINFSTSQAWMDAVGKDSKVPSVYASGSFREDLAESTLVAVFDRNVPGEIMKVKKYWQSIRSQYAIIQRQLGDKLMPGGTCSMRFIDSVAVRDNSTDAAKYDDDPVAYSVEDPGWGVTIRNRIWQRFRDIRRGSGVVGLT